MAANTDIRAATPAAIPDVLPVLPLRDTLVFPQAVVPLVVGQKRSIKLVDDVMRTNRLIALVAQRSPEIEKSGPADLFKTGTVATIHRLARAADGTLRLVVQGLERVRLGEFTGTEPYLVARVEVVPDRVAPSAQTPALRRVVLDLFRKLVGLVDEMPKELVNASETLTDPRQVAYLVATAVTFPTATRQELLELDPVDAKLNRLVELLQQEVSLRELGRKITSEAQDRMGQAQREYFLREQLRAIRQELGEGAEGGEEGGDLRRRIEQSQLPEEARREAERELNRLTDTPAASPEHGMIRTYLEWMADLPWSTLTGGAIDVPHARQVLDEDHFDLEKVKDRILEYLAVRKLRQERLAWAEATGAEVPPASSEAGMREPILCFVGPPGVGKTSLGQSIARALGRRFVRMALGGIRDEAEIRGHRRTYIGAMPGRIIQGIKRAEARDPVFMLDEIDKVGADWRGDPSSALLEVLDPAQNHSFVDTYLGVGFDLTQVLFITTANTLDTIPPALLDRMEVLRLAGYSDQEKLHIAEKYLIPKERVAHGLLEQEVSFESEAVMRIIHGYTREAGVRNLDRQVAALCRKVARDIAEGRTEPVRVTPDLVGTYLGRPMFFESVAERTERPGVATGLAWTPTGGEVLFIEAALMSDGQVGLLLTGMLGDVMRESAQAALSYVKGEVSRLGIDPQVFSGKTVHVHVPSGAVPKDGPSAGVAMLAAIVSIASRRPLRGDVAMTGEITLRGKVLPVGGIKEKVLAAHRAGIKTVVLPRHNERDLEDVTEEVRKALEFVFADVADDVLKVVFPTEEVAPPGATP